jgi:hypothetical protein
VVVTKHARFVGLFKNIIGEFHAARSIEQLPSKLWDVAFLACLIVTLEDGQATVNVEH